MSFAEKLKQLREDAGLTQVRLAEKSGLPLGSLRGYEQGQREPYWYVLFRLSAALGVSVEAFDDCVEVPAVGGKAKVAKPKRKWK
jgi:transcriptional regulator with XRE-family HTH domain